MPDTTAVTTAINQADMKKQSEIIAQAEFIEQMRAQYFAQLGKALSESIGV